jgi:hypothetical protein
MWAPSNLGVGLKAFAVTPHDSTSFTSRARTLYVGTTGNVTIVNADGTTCLFSNVPAGAFIPAECIRVNATGTTASNIVGLV